MRQKYPPRTCLDAYYLRKTKSFKNERVLIIISRNAVLTSSNYFKPIVEEKISGEESNLFRYRSCGDLLRIPPHMRIDTKTFVKYLSDPECHLNKFNLEPKIGGRKRNVLIGNYKIQTNAGYGWCARKKYRQEMEPSVHGPTLAISRKKRRVT